MSMSRVLSPSIDTMKTARVATPSKGGYSKRVYPITRIKLGMGNKKRSAQNYFRTHPCLFTEEEGTHEKRTALHTKENAFQS